MVSYEYESLECKTMYRRVDMLMWAVTLCAKTRNFFDLLLRLGNRVAWTMRESKLVVHNAFTYLLPGNLIVHS